MPNRRAIKGVLRNFLGTYTSRYSDFDGYWVFGFLVGGLSNDLSIDLLGADTKSTDAAPLTFAKRLAAQKFAEQISKAGLPQSWFREARLVISALSDTIEGFVNGRRSSGYNLKFQAHAVTDLGRTIDCELCVFVAPHDPRIESRSTRIS